MNFQKIKIFKLPVVIHLTFFVCSGYFCTLGSEEPAPVGKTYGDVCPAGYYCNNGTHTPAPCLPGTFLNSTGMGDINNCLQCSPGK